MDPTQIPLRELHLPAEIGWWPLAPGWWVIIAILAAGLCWLGYRAFLNWRADRARRVALRQLAYVAAEYQSTGNATELAIKLSELLRRAVLAYAPRADVAGLTGEPWLVWLDRGLEEPVFAKGPGQSIESLPYRAPAEERETLRAEAEALIEAVRTRLETPLTEGVA